jgi:hypothetical protein
MVDKPKQEADVVRIVVDADTSVVSKEMEKAEVEMEEVG